MMFPENCERCGCSLKDRASATSFFNTQHICMSCIHAEKAHPRYQEAVDAEIAACKRGDFNFPGIGKPSDL